jgi:chromosomal replication initiation ATPase DnaA
MGNDSLPLATCQEPETKSYHQVKREVCAKHKITVEELDGPRKFKKLTLARQEAWWRGRYECKKSYPWLAYYSGQKDHTTILHGVKRYNDRLESRSFAKREGQSHSEFAESGR